MDADEESAWALASSCGLLTFGLVFGFWLLVFGLVSAVIRVIRGKSVRSAETALWPSMLKFRLVLP
jgi:hypothetical protein